MNTNPRHLFLCSLLALFSLGVWAQQAASSGSVDTLPHVTASPFTLQPSTKTADGVSVCRAEDKSAPLPGVIPPKPTYIPEVTLPEEAREFFGNWLAIVQNHHIAIFVSLMGLTVDEKGMPRDICVFKEAGHGLDKKAFDSVAKYRFDPATLDGKPLPMHVVVEVDFKPPSGTTNRLALPICPVAYSYDSHTCLFLVVCMAMHVAAVVNPSERWSLRFKASPSKSIGSESPPMRKLLLERQAEGNVIERVCVTNTSVSS